MNSGSALQGRREPAPGSDVPGPWRARPGAAACARAVCGLDADRQSRRHDACARSRSWPAPTRSSPRTPASRERLLARYGIETPLSPYHEHNAAEARPRALRRMAEGQALALISDAGTPLVSDPGYKLVAEAVAVGLAVTAAPGPCAALAALCVAGLPTDRFFFEGFLPPKARGAAGADQRARRRSRHAGLLRSAGPARRDARRPRRSNSGPRPAAVARELTKLHEEIRRGALDALAAQYAAEARRRARSSSSSARPRRGRASRRDASTATSSRRCATLSVKDAAAAVAARHGLPRRQVYARALALAGARR